MSEGGTVTDYLGIEPTLRSSADEINEQDAHSLCSDFYCGGLYDDANRLVFFMMMRTD